MSSGDESPFAPPRVSARRKERRAPRGHRISSWAVALAGMVALQWVGPRASLAGQAYAIDDFAIELVGWAAVTWPPLLWTMLPLIFGCAVFLKDLITPRPAAIVANITFATLGSTFVFTVWFCVEALDA